MSNSHSGSDQSGSTAPSQKRGEKAEPAEKRGHGFGTSPVFLASISTILGVIMFLRFGYAVGHVGMLGALWKSRLSKKIPSPFQKLISCPYTLDSLPEGIVPRESGFDKKGWKEVQRAAAPCGGLAALSFCCTAALLVYCSVAWEEGKWHSLDHLGLLQPDRKNLIERVWG